MVQRVICDVDTGTDDAVALMVAALSPELELLGATTVNGNQYVEICTENTLRVFDYIGVKIPVFEGLRTPILRPDFPIPMPRLPGSDVFHGEYLEIPNSKSKRQPQHAVDWIIQTLMESEGDIILIPTAPLSNIAMAMRKEPRILPKIKELVIMGGGHEVGNSTPSAEFNVWADPEAARVVINCGRPIRLIPLDATHKALVSQADCDRLRDLGTPAGIAASKFIGLRIKGHDLEQPMSEPHTAPVHDALAVCAILDPSVVQTEFMNVDVETMGELTVGRTVCDVHHANNNQRKPNVHVALDADRKKFVEMLMRILARTA